MIYVLIDPETWMIRYVGKTRQTLKSRLYMHVKYSLDRGYLPVHHWINSLTIKGLRPIIRGLDSPGWYGDERDWIERLVFCDLFNQLLTMPIPEALKAQRATDGQEA